ncbi:ABC-2 type transport system ATP-binding protein [Evansella caseinilytica]|uniref:ABC-2 type transport system ATP-binding protein n=1 Tax=Evansella caseinilytica TaxID=1503961 RepID=A0A1H3T5B9_9BACI|nr:ABC transporter ATP-binding protein [Evansella caseinilytica]SDZ45240.1 ABC-2 type transport system ATP-binding protein [Evansella caseinilytica]
MIKVKDVVFRYDSQAKATIDHLSLEVSAGSICGLLGPNGAGKTTTIQLILGLLQVEQGIISIEGCSLADDPITYKKCIGYVSDSHSIYDSLTGQEYLNFMADMYEVSEAKRAAVYAPFIEEFQVQAYLNSPIKSYSHGTRQKFSIMASLVHDPILWILDEPMTGLDIEASRVLKQRMRAHKERGHAVLFSSHILEVCEQLCDTIAIIHQGKCRHTASLANDGSGEGKRSLEDLYLEVVKH